MLRIKTNKILLSVILLVTCNATLSYAQSVSFTVQAPRQVIEGNKFSITYILKNAEGRNLRAPDVAGCTKLYGPSVSTSYSQQWINGASSSSSTQEFAITYRADKAGKYNVSSASIDVNGKNYTSQSATIEVLPPDKSISNSNQGGQNRGVQVDDPTSQASSKPIKSSDLFVKINLSKSHAYEQEAIVCTIKLYTKYQVAQFMPTLQPSFNGFLIEELPITAQLNEVEHYNGENYMVAVLKQCLLYPQQSGNLTITSGNYDLTVIQYEQYRSMFGTMRQPVERQLKVKSNSASINITPLPQPQPANFSGAVGDFKVSSELNAKQFKTNEAATFTYNIQGTGNIKYIKNPIIDFPSQFEVYDPQSTINAKPLGGNVSGSMKIEYTFVPQYVGDFTIPGTQFVYFSTATKNYVTLKTPSYNLKVAKGVGGSPSSIEKKQIEQKNKDILHIKSGNLNLSKDHPFYISGTGYLLWYIIPLIFVISILIIYRKTLKARANVQLMKTKRANKVAKKRLKLAKQFMMQHQSSKFYDEMLKAVWGYLSDKLQIPVSMLNKENIVNELSNYGASQEIADNIISILDSCEFAQYAPEQTDAEMGILYTKTSETMDQLENTKKKLN